MSIPTKEESQDKFSRKVDKNLWKKRKQVPLREESWNDLNQRGASLADQLEWIKINKSKNDNNRCSEV